MDNTVRCIRCILPSTTPGIQFDKQGVCNYCRSYVPMKVLGEEELVKLINGFRNPDAKYDCLVSISGGRDSTFALWKAVKDYKLRVLTTNYRNPFTSEQAYTNMQRALDILGLECVYWEFPNDAHRKDTAKALKAWSHHPSSAMIPIVCSHCKAWWPTFFQIARKNNIKLILIGSNPLETASFKQAGLGGARSYHKLSMLPRIIKKASKELFANPRYLSDISYGPVFKAYFMASHTAPYLRWRYKDITVVRLFDYLKWEESSIIDTISKELGWQKASEVESSWRFDCRLDYVRRLMYANTVGVSELQDLFSKMIREGQITREEALARMEKEDYVPISVVENVLENLNLTTKDLGLG